jgi:predicted small lipoprotein YifL
MVPPNFKDRSVNRSSRPGSAPWILLAVAAIALALAGCGRKGPLDPPPNAAAPVVEQSAGDEARTAAKGNVFDPSYGANELPATPKGDRRTFILDPLLKSD